MMPQRRKGYTENEYGQPYDYFSSSMPQADNAGQEAANTATQQAVQAQQQKREQRDAQGDAMTNLALSYFTGGATGVATAAASGGEGLDATGRAMNAAAEGGQATSLAAPDRSAAAAAAIGATSTGTDPKSIPSAGQAAKGTGENAPGMAEGYIPRGVENWDPDAQAEIKKRKADYDEKQRKYTNTGALIARAAFPFLNRVWDSELARDQQSLDSLQSDYRQRYGAALQRGQLGETSRMNQIRATGEVKEIAGKVFVPRYDPAGNFKGYENATPQEESDYINKTRQAALEKSMADAARDAASTAHTKQLTANAALMPQQFEEEMGLKRANLGIARQELGLRARQVGVQEGGLLLNRDEFNWRSQYPPHGQSGVAGPMTEVAAAAHLKNNIFGQPYENLTPEQRAEWDRQKALLMGGGGERTVGEIPVGSIRQAPLVRPR